MISCVVDSVCFEGKISGTEIFPHISKGSCRYIPDLSITLVSVNLLHFAITIVSHLFDVDNCVLEVP
jgi:hypothetical protein